MPTTLLDRPVLHRPAIVGDASRRQFLAGLAAAGLLAACGSRDDGAVTPTPSLRTVTTDNGPLDIPTSPTRVVAAIGSFETDMVASGSCPC